MNANQNISKVNDTYLEGKNTSLFLLECISQFLFSSNRKTEIEIHLYQLNSTKHLLEFTAKQGILSPLIHTILFNKLQNLSPAFRQKLQQTNQFITRRNQQQSRELARVFQHLQKAGVPAVAYKGHAFASQFYGNIFQRVSVDIDFALDLKYFEAARTVMFQLGYEELKGGLHEDTIEKSRAYYLDYPFVLRNKEGKIIFNVEFHWTPSHHILNIPITFEEFMDKTEEVKIGRFKTITFDKVHQALFAIIHHGNVDCWGKLKHLVDFALILKTLTDSEIQQLEDLCKKYKIYNSYEIGKAFLARLFDQDIDYKKAPSDRWIQEVIEGKLTGNWSDNKRKFLYFISSRDSFRDKISAAFSIIKYQLFIKKHLE